MSSQTLDSHFVVNTDLAWAAGIVDGEGYIGIIKGHSSHMICPTYDAVLQVSMTHEDTVRRLHIMFGCGHVKRHQARYNNCRPEFTWHCSTLATRKVLEQIIPYLHTKKEQAKYIVEYIGRRTIRQEFGGVWKVPLEELTQRDFFYRLLRALNRRGKIRVD